MVKRPTFTPGKLVGIIAYAVLGAGILILFVSDAKQDVAVREAKASTVTCIKNVLDVSNKSAVERAEAAADRDESLVASKRALRELIRLRVIEQVKDSVAVRQAADQYMIQTQRFIEASERLKMARANHPVPDVEDLCQ